MCCRFTSRSRVHLTRMGFSRVFFSLLSEVSWLLLGFKRHYLGFTGFLRSKYVRVWPETAGTCWRVAFFSPTHLLTRLRRKGSEKKKTRWLVIFFNKPPIDLHVDRHLTLFRFSGLTFLFFTPPSLNVAVKTIVLIKLGRNLVGIRRGQKSPSRFLLDNVDRVVYFWVYFCCFFSLLVTSSGP